MEKELGHVFQFFMDTFVEERVEQLTIDAEKTEGYIKGRRNMQHLIEKASRYIDLEDLDILINAVRGADIAIYEYMYKTGIKDGIWLSDHIEQIKK